MLTFNLKTSFAVLLIGIVIGFSISFIFKGCMSNYGDAMNEKIIQPKELKEQVATTEASYEVKLNDLGNKNQTFQQELKSTKQQLAQSKARTRQREKAIKKIIAPKGFLAKDLLKKVSSLPVVNDSNLSKCDSLSEQVDQYIQENIQNDSLYQAEVNIQDSIIMAKDFIISLNIEKYNDLKKVFSQSLIQQEKLIVENSLLQKKFKRQKLRNKLTAIGVTIISGLAANYLIHH